MSEQRPLSGQSQTSGRSKAIWLDWFAVFQGICGLAFLWLAIARQSRSSYAWQSIAGELGLSVNLPLFLPALAHLTLAYCIWTRRRWFWLPHVFVVVLPWVGMLLDRPPGHPPSGVGYPGIAIILTGVLTAVLISSSCLVYCGEIVVLVTLLLHRDKYLVSRQQRPYRISLAGMLLTCVLVSGAVGLDIRFPLERIRQRAIPEQISNQVAEKFFAAVQQEGPSAVEVTRQRLHVLHGEPYYSTLSRLGQGLQHADPRVRLATIQLLSPPPGQREYGHLARDQQDALLAIIANTAESDELRRAAVAAFMQTGARGRLFLTLAGLVDKGAFAVDVVTGDWSGTCSEDTIVFLKDLGPLAKDAVPNLAMALEHPDEWGCLRRAAEALGAIGPASTAAVPNLLVTCRSQSPEVRAAAAAALAKISPELGNSLVDLDRILARGRTSSSSNPFDTFSFEEGELDDEGLGQFCEGLEKLDVADDVILLSLNGISVTDAGLQHLPRLPNLTLLNLDRTSVTDAGLRHLRSLERLRWLTISSTLVTDAGLEHLALLKRLESVELQHTAVTDAGLAAFRSQDLQEGDDWLAAKRGIGLHIDMDVDARVTKPIEQAGGFVNDRFALCQDLPWKDLRDVTRQLHLAGYRPSRVRPYRAGGEIKAAALWQKGGVGPWRLSFNAAANEILEQDEALVKQGYSIVDLAGYDLEGNRYAAIWFRSTERATHRALIVGEGVRRLEDSAKWKTLRERGYAPITWQHFLDRDQNPRQCLITTSLTDWLAWGGERKFYDKIVKPDLFQTDICVAREIQDGNSIPLFIGCWQPHANLETVALVGLDPATHLESCRKLAEQGYNPVAISAASIVGDQPDVAASVWSRPRSQR